MADCQTPLWEVCIRKTNGARWGLRCHMTGRRAAVVVVAVVVVVHTLLESGRSLVAVEAFDVVEDFLHTQIGFGAILVTLEICLVDMGALRVVVVVVMMHTLPGSGRSSVAMEGFDAVLGFLHNRIGLVAILVTLRLCFLDMGSALVLVLVLGVFLRRIAGQRRFLYWKFVSGVP